MYQPSLTNEYQQYPATKIEAKDKLTSYQGGSIGTNYQNTNLVSTQPVYASSIPVRYSSPFTETRQVYTLNNQQNNIQANNIQIQSTQIQSEPYSSPHFIKQSAGNAQNFSAATTPKSNTGNHIVFQNNPPISATNQSQNVAKNQTEATNNINAAHLSNQQSNIQQKTQLMPTQIVTVQQPPQQVQTIQYQPAGVNYNPGTVFTNQIPVIQSIIRPVLTPQTTQQVILQNPQPISYTTAVNPVTSQIQLAPQVNYLMESKPILQTSQLRILSPASQRVQTIEGDYSRPLFSTKSPYQKRYEDKQDNFNRNESYKLETQPLEQIIYDHPLQRPAYFQEINERQRQPQYEELRDKFSYRNDNRQFNFSQHLEEGRTANFRQQKYEQGPLPSYSYLNSSKLEFRDDTDYKTRQIIESRYPGVEVQRHRSQQSLNQLDFQKYSPTPIADSIQLGSRIDNRSQFRQNNSFFDQGRLRDGYERNSRFISNNSYHQTLQQQQFYARDEVLKERPLTFMFQKRPVELLKEYIQAIVDLERELESHRIKIVKQEDYSIQLFYEIFDINESGYVIVEEFVQGLKKLGIDADQNDVKLLVQRYSLDKNSKLDQQEFINMVVPKTFSHIESIFVRKPYINERNMREETKQLMGKIMKSLLNSEVVLESIRKKIESKQISMVEMYQNLCENPQDSINKQNLREYLVKIGVFAKKEEIPQIMQRFDLKDMGFFRLQEFEAELKPRLY